MKAGDRIIFEPVDSDNPYAERDRGAHGVIQSVPKSGRPVIRLDGSGTYGGGIWSCGFDDLQPEPDGD